VFKCNALVIVNVCPNYTLYAGMLDIDWLIAGLFFHVFFLYFEWISFTFNTVVVFVWQFHLFTLCGDDLTNMFYHREPQTTNTIRLVGCMLPNATFNNISVISWRSVLLVEETGVPGEIHRSVASHWQTLLHNVVRLTLIDIRTHNISGDM
jgi:hypothetical protein